MAVSLRPVKPACDRKTVVEVEIKKTSKARQGCSKRYFAWHDKSLLLVLCFADEGTVVLCGLEGSGPEGCHQLL